MFDIKHSVIPWFLFSITQKQARKLQATLVRNYDLLTRLLTDGGEV